MSEFIRWFSDITIDDVATVGGKNASLGEMVRELAPRGIRVPDGFATTAAAYRHFMESTGLDTASRPIHADGYGMGERRSVRRALYHSGPPGNGAVSTRADDAKDIPVAQQGPAIVRGRAVDERIGAGPVRVITGIDELSSQSLLAKGD